MRPKHYTMTLAGTNTVTLPVDWRQSPFSIRIQAIVTGTVTYSVTRTSANVFDSTLTPSWSPVLTAQTTSQEYIDNDPAMAYQFTVTAGTGSVDFYILNASRNND